MRMWLVNPKLMCRKHLLGEHVECHMFLGSIKHNHKLSNYLKNGLLDATKLKERHDELAKEILNRGYKHNSPLPDITEEEKIKYKGSIDIDANMNELARRCPICANMQSEKMIPNQIQQEALKSIEKQRVEGKALIVMPSGSGKTLLSAFDSLQFGAKRVLFIAHRNEILERAAEEYKRVYTSSQNIIGFVNQEKKEFEKRFVFANISTISRLNNLQKISEQKYDYVVVDEYHHSAARMYERIYGVIKPKFLLGLTATPYRMDGKDITRYVNKNIPYELKLEKAEDYSKALKAKAIVPFEYHGLMDNVDYSNIVFSGFKYNEKDLNKTLLIEKRDRMIIKEFRQKIGIRKTMGFCATVRHVKRMVRKFNNAGIASAGVVYNTSLERRKEIIRDFKAGKYQIIFSRDIFNEGVDIPNIEAVMVLRPTLSKTIFWQQIGRGLRPASGKKKVIILDFVGNWHKAYRIKEWLKDYILKGGKRNLKPEYYYKVPTVHFSDEVLDLFTEQQKAIITKEILIQQFFDLKKRLGRQPWSSDLNGKNGTHVAHTYIKIFGTWKNFLTEIGEPIIGKSKPFISKEEIISKWKKAGKPITPKEFEKKTGISIQTVNQRFGIIKSRHYGKRGVGGLTKFLIEMGEKPLIHNWTKKSLIAEFKRRTKELGHQPRMSSREWNYGYAAREFFGTWNNFVVAAGGKISKTGRRYGPNAKEELIKLWKKEGKPKREREFARNRSVSKYFGNWNNFMESVGEKPI
jgi:superfamily II DNA or RNA helicase